MRLLRSPYLLMTLAMLCWAGNWLLARALRADLTPIGLNFWRWGVALLLLLPFAIPRLPAAWPILRANWPILGLLGLLGVAVFQQLVYLALEYTTAINAAIFNSTGPIVIVCISWLAFRDRISSRQGVGILLSMIGVLGIVTRGNPQLLLELEFNPGDLWALATVPIWSAYTVLLRRRPEELDPVVFLAVLATVGVTLMSPVYAWDVWAGGGMRFTLPTMGVIAYTAVFASLVAYFAWNSAVPQVGANKAGLFLHLHPTFTALFAVLFLGETLHAYHAVSVGLIVLGIYLTTATGTSATDGTANVQPTTPAAPAAGPSLMAALWTPSRTAAALLTLAMLVWTGNILLGRSMHAAFTPTNLSFYRWALALVLLLPFTARGLWRKRAVLAGNAPILIVLGILGVAAFNWLLYQAVNQTTATNAALIYANVPVFTVLVTGLIFRERVRLRQALGIAISMIGVVAIITQGDPSRLLNWVYNPGDLWALATVPAWGLYTIALRRRPADLTPLEFMTAIVVVGLLLLTPAFLWEWAQGVRTVWDWRTAGSVAYLGVMASIVAFMLWNAGVPRIGATKAGLFTHLYPLFTAVAAVLLLGETLHWFHLSGAVLIFLGLFLTTAVQDDAAAPSPALPGTESTTQPERAGSVVRPQGIWGLLTSPYLLLIVNMLLWSGNWVVGRGLRETSTPMGLNFWRWALALAWLLPFTWPTIWNRRRVVLRHWKLLLALGILGVSLFNYMGYMALQLTTANDAVLINSILPVMIILFAWVLLRERLTWLQGVGVVISLVGALVIVSRADWDTFRQLRFNEGNLWILGAVPVWALYSVLLRLRPPELPPMALLAVLILVGVVAMLPFSLYAHAKMPQLSLDAQTLAGVGYLALFTSLIGVSFYNYGVAKLGPSVTGLFLHLIPPFTAAMAWVVLGEVLHLYHVAGAALTFSGIYLATIAGRGGAPIQPSVDQID